MKGCQAALRRKGQRLHRAHCCSGEAVATQQREAQEDREYHMSEQFPNIKKLSGNWWTQAPGNAPDAFCQNDVGS